MQAEGVVVFGGEMRAGLQGAQKQEQIHFEYKTVNCGMKPGAARCLDVPTVESSVTEA